MVISRAVRVVHLGRSTCHAISGRGDKSTLATYGLTSGPPSVDQSHAEEKVVIRLLRIDC